LLEVGTGFHPELTGRENIYLNGTILGMSKAEIDRKFDEIVDFSGVEKFIDTPVKRYSSGMRVRLAFSVAAHLEPEILLVDEVLAVGDAEFQQKSLGKMENVAKQGRTVLFVSHQMTAVDNLCQRALLLERGEVVDEGPTSDVITGYLTSKDIQETRRQEFDDTTVRSGTGEAYYKSIDILTDSSQSLSSVQMGATLTFRMELRAESRLEDLQVGIGLFNAYGIRLCGFNSHDVSHWTIDIDSNKTEFVDCHIPLLYLAPGKYYINLLLRKKGGEKVDYIERAVFFHVVAADVFGTGRTPRGQNLIFLPVEWRKLA
jgi:lipopolysaccharide transport system ATP-binding protein